MQLKPYITIKDSVRVIKRYLTVNGFENPQLEAELVVSYSTGFPRTLLENLSKRVLTKEQIEKLNKCLEKCENGMPIQFFIGYTEIKGTRIFISKDTLLPGPEIEIMIDSAIDYLAKYKFIDLKIIDLGTGCGVLAVVLAKYFPKSHIYAVDISPNALKIAKKCLLQWGNFSDRFCSWRYVETFYF